jgi:adenylate cyclase
VTIVLAIGRLLESRAIGRVAEEGAVALANASSREAGEAVENSLYGAEATLDGLGRQLKNGSVTANDIHAVERALLGAILARPSIMETALTTSDGHQVSITRDAKGALVARLTQANKGDATAFSAAERKWTEGQPPLPFGPPRPVPNPAEDYTFTSPFSYDADLLWTDLAYAAIDRWLPEPRRRLEVSVLGVVHDVRDEAAGVIRVGTSADEVNRIIAQCATPSVRLFLCDPDGRLLTPVRPGEPVSTVGDDLRYMPASMPAELLAALQSPLRRPGANGEDRQTQFRVNGQPLVLRYRTLKHTQSWQLGTLVYRDRVPGVPTLLAASKRASMVGIAALVLGVLGAAGLAIAVQGGLGQVLAETARMRKFDLAPRAITHSFSDIARLLAGLEGAKAALRTLGLYAPLELVRDLYQSGREPQLASAPADIAILFTDLAGFTTMTEHTRPDQLARLLGAYFEAMADAITSCGGTIDKYVGDAVMALFGAPTALGNPSRNACQAVLACEAATQRLYTLPEWAGLPPLVTRYGVNRARVLVGHFGAPNRMSYTAVGDGVNLAARLESLGKEYNVTRLVSERVAREAGPPLEFRPIDRVVVRGKTEPVEVFELLLPS